MKKQTTLILSRSVFAAGLVLLLLSSCKTSTTTMQVLVPARIDIPNNIQSVGIINRSLPEKGNTLGNILEGLISGESILADREASERCIAGVTEHLNQAPRFRAVAIYGANLKGTGTKQFAPPIQWNEVDRLCKQYNVDALAVLESFDSDIFFDRGERKVKRKVNDREVMVTEYLADLNIRVNAGWRIYDNTQKRIIDENVYTDERQWDSRGDSPEEAFRRLPSKRRALDDAGHFSGQQYAIRISPNWLTVSRSYYKKGNDRMKLAREYTKRGNWDSAITTWKIEAQNADPEIAGRACYNMAVASERSGDLETALIWANKALKDYNNKKAAAYIAILQQRLYDQQRLDRQMGL